jgi:hypothetical protein
MTFFQTEMTSLIKFQSEREKNIPFFMSYSIRNVPRWGGDNAVPSYGDAGSIVFDGLIGGHIKLNDYFYIPVFVSLGTGGTAGIPDDGTLTINGKTNETTEYGKTGVMDEGNSGFFCGSGLFFNGGIIKGAMYAGYSFHTQGIYGIIEQKPGRYKVGYQMVYLDGFHVSGDEGQEKHSFKFAFVPLVKTSQMKGIGSIFSSLLGYIGTASTVETATNTLISALNYGLDLTFNKAHFDAMSLNTEFFYKRGNYDAAARNDAYGLAIQGLFTGLPLAFSFEGGYKHFSSVSKYFASYYSDTIYFDAGLSYAFRPLTLGMIYQYDNIRKSSITFALIARFGSYFFGLSNVSGGEEGIGQYYAVRYRHGAWR